MNCAWCPPACRSCAGDRDCECYSHQNWPDTHIDRPDLSPRLGRCLDLSGCDGLSHDINCNAAFYAPSLSDAAPEGGRAHRLTDCWCGKHHAPEDFL